MYAKTAVFGKASAVLSKICLYNKFTLFFFLALWSGTSCCDDAPGGPPPPDYDGPTVLRSPRTPLMRKYRFVVGPGVAIDGSGELPAVTSGPGHMYETPLLREPADVTSFVNCDVGSHNLASISS